MKFIKMGIPFIILISLFWGNCSRPQESSILKRPYLGQTPPGPAPEIFAPGIVSTDMEEFGCSFTPDGREFYFTRKVVDSLTQKQAMTILVSRLEDSGWSEPESASFCQTEFDEGEPNFSPDGKLVLYGRLQKLNDGSFVPRVMVAHRTEEGWGEPVNLMHGMFATITGDSMIYYTDVSQGHSKGDIYRTKFDGRGHSAPEKLGGKINSPEQDAHPFVLPGGDILIFDSNRPGGFGDNDLYICFLQDNGSWGDPVNMGAVVNSEAYDAIPNLSSDGKYFFFFRNNNIYWVDAYFIDGLRKSGLK